MGRRILGILFILTVMPLLIFENETLGSLVWSRGSSPDHRFESYSCKIANLTLNIESAIELPNGAMLVLKRNTTEIWRSTDRGKTFANFSTLPGNVSLRGGNFFRSSDGNLFIGFGGKISKSSDNGANWTAVYDLPYDGTRSNLTCLYVWNFVEDNNSNLYGGVYHGPETPSAYIVKSSDHGNTWGPCCHDNTIRVDGYFNHIHGMYHNPFNDWIYACIEWQPYGVKSGILRSKDAGQSWALINNGTQMTVIVGRGNSADVYFFRDLEEDTILYKMTDSGTDSENLTTYKDFGDWGFTIGAVITNLGRLVFWTKGNNYIGYAVNITSSTDASWSDWIEIQSHSITPPTWDGYGYGMDGTIADTLLIGAWWNGATVGVKVSFDFVRPPAHWYDDFNDGSMTEWNVTTIVHSGPGPAFIGPIPAVAPDWDLYMKSQGDTTAEVQPKADSTPTPGSVPLALMDWSNPYIVELWFYMNTSNNHWFDVFSNRHLWSVIDHGTAFTVRQWTPSGDVNTLVWSLKLNTWYMMRYWVDPQTQTFQLDVYETGTGFVVSGNTYNFHGEWHGGLIVLPTFRLGDRDTVAGDHSYDHGEAFWDDVHVWFAPTGVGGVVVPIDKLGLLAPYIALASTILIATAATAIYVKRRKKKQ